MNPCPDFNWPGTVFQLPRDTKILDSPFPFGGSSESEQSDNIIFDEGVNYIKEILDIQCNII